MSAPVLDPQPPTLPRGHTDRDVFEPLCRRLRGNVAVPGDVGFDVARKAWNLAVEQRPSAIVDAATSADVQTAIRFAAAHGFRVAMQSTGHGAATLVLPPGTLLVRTGALSSISIDPDARTARVEAGVVARDLVARAAVHGLAFPVGSSEAVGVIGYTLGGGAGWLGRRHGLACNHVVAAEVVTADGDAIRVDHRQHPELFWALRGGGGAFAAVTALELALHPLPRVHAGTLRWPIERAAEVLHVWRVWTQEVPDGVTSIARVLHAPEGSCVVVEVNFLDGETHADRWLRTLRSLRPVSDTFATVAPSALGSLHGDPAQPVRFVADHRLLRDLPPDALDGLLELVGPGRRTPLHAVDLRHLGGAMGTSRPGHGVLDRLDAGYALFAVGLPTTSAAEESVRSHLAAIAQRTEPWDAGTAYLNFADRPIDPARLFGDERFARLQAVKRAYDPQDLLVSNHPIPI
jgi:FAD/FMN-containing dehydrogenase